MLYKACPPWRHFKFMVNLLVKQLSRVKVRIYCRIDVIWIKCSSNQRHVWRVSEFAEFIVWSLLRIAQLKTNMQLLKTRMQLLTLHCSTYQGLLDILLNLLILEISFLLHEEVQYTLFLQSISLLAPHWLDKFCENIIMPFSLEIQMKERSKELLHLLLIQKAFLIVVEIIEKFC